MQFTSKRAALNALFTLLSYVHSTDAQITPSAPSASTAPGVMKSEGCFSSSGNLNNVGSGEWQSSSYCHGKCVALNMPVLALQSGNCWCGDLMPAEDTQVSSSECNTGCPGYPDESCGGTDAWTVWLTGAATSVGYLDGGNGGSGESSASITTTPSSTASVANTGVASSPSSVATSDSSSPDTSASPETTSASSPTSIISQAVSSSQQVTTPVTVVTSAEPTTVVATITVGGAVQTVIGTTIVHAPATGTPTATKSPSQVGKSSGGSSKVGIAVGVVVGILVLAAVIGAAVFYFRRKNRRSGNNRHSRQSSMDVFRTTPPRIPFPTSTARISTLNDSRLDPRAMVDKRQSGGSMFADNVDYSRRILKVTNPDG